MRGNRTKLFNIYCCRPPDPTSAVRYVAFVCLCLSFRSNGGDLPFLSEHTGEVISSALTCRLTLQEHFSFPPTVKRSLLNVKVGGNRHEHRETGSVVAM